MPLFPSIPIVESYREVFSNHDVCLTGLRGSSLARMLSDISLDRQVLVVFSEPEHAEDFLSDLTVFGSHNEGILYPAWDTLPTESDQSDTATSQDLLHALRIIDSGKACWIATTVHALLQPAVSLSVLNSRRLSVSIGQVIKPEDLLRRLVSAGFDIAASVDAPFQASRRGGIIDVYPLLSDNPIRIEFFDDEIESLREFDPVTQESTNILSREVVLIEAGRDSFREAFLSDHKESVLSCFGIGTVVILVNPTALSRVAELYFGGFEVRNHPLLTWDKIVTYFDKFHLTLVDDYASEWSEHAPRAGSSPLFFDAGVLGLERFDGGVNIAVRELNRLLSDGFRITLFCHSDSEQQRITDYLRDQVQYQAI